MILENLSFESLLMCDLLDWMSVILTLGSHDINTEKALI